MSDSQTASVGANSTAVKPRDVIAFRTSLHANQCLVGVVASKPSAPQPDGTTSVLVQPRPLILVPPQPPQSKKVKAVRLTGQLVDRADSAVAQLAVTPIPSASVSKAPVPAKDASTSAVVTAEELREMQAQQLSLQSDLDTSKARVSEIDNLLLQNALAKQRQQKADNTRNSSPASTPFTTPRPSTADAVIKSVKEAVKATDAAERELLLSRAGLRTVKSVAWASLQRLTRRTSSQCLVGLIETAAALLHDAKCAHFDDVVQQSPTLAKRLAAVKAQDVTDEDCAKAQSFLQAWPTAEAVEKEHKEATTLHRWLSTVLKAAQAHKDLRDAQAATAASPASGGAEAGVGVGATKNQASSEPHDPAARSLDVMASDAENALRNERQDQLEYIQMAEEEISVLDALITEANALAKSQPASPHKAQDTAGNFLNDNLQSSQTILPALTVPMSWIVCVFSTSDAPDMEACAAKPRGTVVAFSLPASHKLVTTVCATARSSGSSGGSPRGSGLNAQKPPTAETRRPTKDEEEEKSRCWDEPSALPPTTRSPRRTSGLMVSPRPSSLSSSSRGLGATAREAGVGSSQADAPAVASPPSPLTSHEAELEEKVRLLEARLSAALQQNPKEAELQLLRDEVDAKRVELQRVTDERDRLLQERREKSMWCYGSAMRRTAAGTTATNGDQSITSGQDRSGGPVSLSSPPQRSNSELYARQLSSPRDMVDRSIVDELEEQLTAAHQRISELQIEVSQMCKPPSVPIAIPDAVESASPAPSSAPVAGEASEASSKAASLAAAPSPSPPTRTVTQEAYEELESRLQSVTAELEAQRRNTQKLEEQLNGALHRSTEAEGVVAAQKRELEEVWEKLEAVEAWAEEHDLLTEQRLLMAQAQQSASAKQQQPGQSRNAAASSVSSTGTLHVSPQPLGPLSPSVLPRPPAQSTASNSQHETSTGYLIPFIGDAETKSQPNDDATTAATGTGFGNASRVSLDAATRTTSAEAFPTFGAATLMSPESVFHSSPYSRGTSVALQSRPVEQLSTIELRHEVHRLREELERHQSVELRLTMDLQTIREKQKAEHKRRRDARVARMQMLTRMQDSIAEVIEKSNRELEAIPALLERGKAEAEALMAKRRMHR